MNRQMSEQTKVDVLQVLDAAITRMKADARHYRIDNDPDTRSLQQARAAVAELVEAARVVTVRTAAGHFTADARDLAALAAALARFGGAK